MGSSALDKEGRGRTPKNCPLANPAPTLYSGPAALSGNSLKTFSIKEKFHLLLPGSHVCGDEDLKNTGLEPG